jgi:selenocysteine-specific elongation factor
MLVVGTAGHIDHGKSSIVRRLTGTDPDRLPEEKERGMTIDLGFAFFQTTGNDEIAFVDVPGHERFVKNMIAGAGGIDVVMLVIAADDGWMPQSQEHFQIIKLLAVRHGLIVINKIDLSTADWVALLEEEIREKVKGSVLESVPIFRVSAQTGEGFDHLRSHLDQLPRIVEQKRDIGKARLYIDRSFVRPGIGGVVTGTLRGGSLTVGQQVSVWPSQVQGKVRSLQSTNHDVTTAAPGQRTAVALTGIDKELLVRGGVISGRADLSHFADHPVLAVSIQMLPESPVPLEDRRRVFLMVGTTEMEGEVRLFESTDLKAGESGIAFIRPDQPMLSHAGDHFILRLPTPMVTLGGGKVLDHLERFPRRRELPDYAYLTDRCGDDLDKWIISDLNRNLFVTEDAILQYAEFDSREIKARCGVLIEQGIGHRFRDLLCVPQAVTLVGKVVVDRLERLVQEQPHLKGLGVDILAGEISRSTVITAVLLEYLTSIGTLTRNGDLYAIAGKETTLKGVIKEAHDLIFAALTAAPYAPPALDQFAGKGKVYQQAIAYMIDTREVYKCGGDFLFLHRVWAEILKFLRDRLNSGATLSIGDLKDRFGFTRKWAIPILEETDRLGITARRGDVREKGERFDA